VRRGLVLFAALFITLVIALVAWVNSGADEASWVREADVICADATAENQAVFQAHGALESPEVIMAVFGRALDNDRRAFARVNALEPPEARVEDVSHLLTLWRTHLDADEGAFADLSTGWSDARFQEWMSTTYPYTVDLEQTARRLGSERCGDYFSPDPT
jgi:hypothetical protein